MNERRRERLAAFVRESLPDFFRFECGFSNDILVSIIHVEPNEASSKVKVYVSVWPDDQRDAVANTLKMSENKAKHYIRARISSKYSPAVSFHVK
ncbi:MAG: ribosome-binding factor A [Patescibacteria group bacterium]